MSKSFAICRRVKNLNLCIMFMLVSTLCLAMPGQDSATRRPSLPRIPAFSVLEAAHRQLTENPDLTSILLSAGYERDVEVWSITMVRNDDGTFSVINKAPGNITSSLFQVDAFLSLAEKIRSD